jgi:hypothetical protein
VGVGLLPGRGETPGGLLLGAGSRLHLLGNDGRDAPPFPFHLPDSVRLASLVAAPAADGNARILAYTAGNSLFLLDARGRQYTGWVAKRLDFPLAGPPVLLGVNGREVVVAPLRNGYIYAFDAQGGLLPGFPLSAGARLAGGVAVQAGATLSRTRLSVINQHGELLVISLGGDVVSRRRVATWSRTATFHLVPDQRGSSFVLTRQDGGRLDVFQPAGGAPLLSQSFVTSGDKPVQLFDFGRGHRVLAVTEPGPGQVFLYDGQGKQLGAQALPSTGTRVGLTYDATTDTYQLVRLVNNELRRTALKLAPPAPAATP